MPAAGEGDIGPFWRVFPWDAAAAPGDPYTPQYILPAGVQTGGRFDLSDVPTQYIALDDPATRKRLLDKTLADFRRQGAQLAVSHLLAQGCKRIAFLGDIRHSEIEMRYLGYQDALQAYFEALGGTRAPRERKP